MNDVDLNHKIWNFRAKTHFYIHSGILAALAMIQFSAFIDYSILPNDASSEVRLAVMKYVLFIPINFLLLNITYSKYMNIVVFSKQRILKFLQFFIAGVYLLLLLCPNRIWYATCMAIVAIKTCYFFVLNSSKLIRNGITLADNEKKKFLMKYYTCGNIANIVFQYGSVLCGIYLCLILFELSFLYVRKRVSDLYVVCVTSPGAQQSTDIAIDSHGNSYISRGPSSPDPALESVENSDPDNENDQDLIDPVPIDQEKSKSGKSKRSQNIERSNKSQKSQKSGKSQKSDKTQKTSITDNSLNLEESVKHVVI